MIVCKAILHQAEPQATNDIPMHALQHAFRNSKGSVGALPSRRGPLDTNYAGFILKELPDGVLTEAPQFGGLFGGKMAFKSAIKCASISCRRAEI
jgi:hypothetical protein